MKIVNEQSLPESVELTENVEKIFNSEMSEYLWFGLKIGDKECKIGLSDILLCLRFAEEHGEVPKLPGVWWNEISGMYPKDEFLSD